MTIDAIRLPAQHRAFSHSNSQARCARTFSCSPPSKTLMGLRTPSVSQGRVRNQIRCGLPRSGLAQDPRPRAVRPGVKSAEPANRARDPLATPDPSSAANEPSKAPARRAMVRLRGDDIVHPQGSRPANFTSARHPERRVYGQNVSLRLGRRLPRKSRRSMIFQARPRPSEDRPFRSGDQRQRMCSK